jgi:hypothetical protein
MPIIVTCECGKSFQAQEQHIGLQAKCKACGRVIVINGQQVQLAAAPVAVQPIANQSPQAVPVQNFAASAQPFDAQAYADVPPESADEVSPQAAAVLLQREMQAAADRKFMMNMAMVAFALMALGGIAAGIYSMTSSEPPKKVAKAPDPEPPKPTPPVKVDTPKPVEQPKPAKPMFDKGALGGTAARQVKWSGVVASGLAEEGAVLVTLRSEELQSGSTATYRAKLKLKQKLDAPLPSGTEIVFDGVLQPGMQQTTDFRQAADGTRLVDAVYIMNISDGVISGKGDATATATTTPAGGKDEVENYFQKAVETKDGHMKKNAEMFHPGDERLGFQGVYRPIPKDAAEKVHNKTDPIATMEDMDAGPDPTPQSDQIEARMLMDPDLVGDGLWLDADSGKSKFFVFLSEPATIMQEVQQKYGPPGKSIKSGKCRLNFYGRFMLVETEGRVFSVLRKLVWAK